MRDYGKLQRRKNPTKNVAQLDVNNDSSVDNAVESIIKENGKINLLVNNAGYDLFGSLEEASIEEIREQFERNFFGIVRTTKAVVPTMRSQGSGPITLRCTSPSDNPEFTYVVGEVAAMALESRKNMSDKEFHESETWTERICVLPLP